LLDYKKKLLEKTINFVDKVKDNLGERERERIIGRTDGFYVSRNII